MSKKSDRYCAAEHGDEIAVYSSISSEIEAEHLVLPDD